MTIQNNIGNVKWKNAQKKQYDIYVSMPEKGTVVVNKLEQADTVKFLKGKTWFSVTDINKLSAENQNTLKNILQQGKAYLVDDAHPFVLAGTLGEFWTIKPDALSKKYNFVVDNNVVAINQASLQKKLKDGILDWTLVRSVPDTSKVFACFMPVEKKGQVKSSYAILNYNDASVQHGKGDFIIARYTKPDGTPDVSNLSVVNGLVFRDTYDNRGWSDCLDSSANKDVIDVSKLPKITKGKVVKSNSDIDFMPYLQQKIQEEHSDYNYIKKNVDKNIHIVSKFSEKVEFLTDDKLKSSEEYYTEVLSSDYNENGSPANYIVDSLALFFNRLREDIEDIALTTDIKTDTFNQNEFKNALEKFVNQYVDNKQNIYKLYKSLKPHKLMFQSTIYKDGDSVKNPYATLIRYMYINLDIMGVPCVLVFKQLLGGKQLQFYSYPESQYLQKYFCSFFIMNPNVKNEVINELEYADLEYSIVTYISKKILTEKETLLHEYCSNIIDVTDDLEPNNLRLNYRLKRKIYATNKNAASRYKRLNVLSLKYKDIANSYSFTMCKVILNDLMLQFWTNSFNLIYLYNPEFYKRYFLNESRDSDQYAKVFTFGVPNSKDYFLIYSGYIEDADAQMHIEYCIQGEKHRNYIPKNLITTFYPSDKYECMELSDTYRKTELYQFIQKYFNFFVNEEKKLIKPYLQKNKDEEVVNTIAQVISRLEGFLNAEGFVANKSYKTITLDELSNGNVYILISEGVNKTANSVKLQFKYKDNVLYYRGKENGVNLNKSINLKTYTRNYRLSDSENILMPNLEAISLILVLKIYMDICDILKLTPFRSMFKLSYINNDFKNMFDGKLFKLLKDSYNQENCFKNCNASVKFKFEWFGYGNYHLFTIDLRLLIDKQKLTDWLENFENYYIVHHTCPDLPEDTFMCQLRIKNVKTNDTALTTIPFNQFFATSSAYGYSLNEILPANFKNLDKTED